MNKLNYLLLPALLISSSVLAVESEKVVKSKFESIGLESSNLTISDVEDRVKNVIVEQLAVDLVEVVGTARLVEDLGADDLDLIELRFALEEEFEISIPDEDWERLTYVQIIIDYILSEMRRRNRLPMGEFIFASTQNPMITRLD